MYWSLFWVIAVCLVKCAQTCLHVSCWACSTVCRTGSIVCYKCSVIFCCTRKTVCCSTCSMVCCRFSAGHVALLSAPCVAWFSAAHVVLFATSVTPFFATHIALSSAVHVALCFAKHIALCSAAAHIASLYWMITLPLFFLNNTWIYPTPDIHQNAGNYIGPFPKVPKDSFGNKTTH